MTVNDLLYHLAALARDGKGDCIVEVASTFDGEMIPANFVAIRRCNLVPEAQVQFVQDYIETVVIS